MAKRERLVNATKPKTLKKLKSIKDFPDNPNKIELEFNRTDTLGNNKIITEIDL